MHSGPYLITGTDTDVGKTVASAALMLSQSGARYWKPVQSGVDGETGLTDRARVQQLTVLPDDAFLPEVYVLSHPLSPHRAAELDGVIISPDKILSEYQSHLSRLAPHALLLIEGAGGLMVPVSRDLLQIDLFVRMQAVAPAPVILVARTALGTINHTLLSVAAIRERGLPLAGILFVGGENLDNMATIVEFSGAPVMGHLPLLAPLNAATLRSAIREWTNNTE